uniref:TNFR-Cys domain-containing protein n=1 Tax=Chromera velia CCMP2878 TaxID=1169474 RepID=A0A0G4ICG3_9ALVE|eukprot:Cvel_13143.t1-p1 / transcript=Cvel_13143.t1 / gene=Cvel_13143 / organism=Chromera_velia_CCMP2878 / gene_product=hypothetical protein / transcript_product=hypothetical protein / location=Cvel_scaffold887:17109-18515(-) / protein_length=469 / sequence_SO=supercontig / SO=protein_coding / is_pseudo=false
MRKCQHKRVRAECEECHSVAVARKEGQGGEVTASGICVHGGRRVRCAECECKHGGRRGSCEECKGSSKCKHKRARSECEECHALAEARNERRGGKVGKAPLLCEHGWERKDCTSCKATSSSSRPCKHGFVHSQCDECVRSRQSRMCGHGRERYYCAACGGRGICVHDRRRHVCKECRGTSQCRHRRVRSECGKCNEGEEGKGEESVAGQGTAAAGGTQEREGEGEEGLKRRMDEVEEGGDNEEGIEGASLPKERKKGENPPEKQQAKGEKRKKGPDSNAPAPLSFQPRKSPRLLSEAPFDNTLAGYSADVPSDRDILAEWESAHDDAPAPSPAAAGASQEGRSRGSKASRGPEREGEADPNPKRGRKDLQEGPLSRGGAKGKEGKEGKGKGQKTEPGSLTGPRKSPRLEKAAIDDHDCCANEEDLLAEFRSDAGEEEEEERQSSSAAAVVAATAQEREGQGGDAVRKDR